jgi:hypothetical protein
VLLYRGGLMVVYNLPTFVSQREKQVRWEKLKIFAVSEPVM